MASRNLRHSGGPDPRLLPHRAMSKMDQLKSFIMAANAVAGCIAAERHKKATDAVPRNAALTPKVVSAMAEAAIV